MLEVVCGCGCGLIGSACACGKRAQDKRLKSHLAQVHVAVGRFAVAIHPQGQDQGQGEDAEREQRVHQHIQHGRHSSGRLDFHCRGDVNNKPALRPDGRSSLRVLHRPLSLKYTACCAYAVNKRAQHGAALSPNVEHCRVCFFSITARKSNLYAN